MAFFHRMASVRANLNSISKIRVDGRWVTEKKAFRQEISQFYQSLFLEAFPCRPKLKGVEFTHRKTKPLGWSILFSEDEVLLAMKSLPEDKAPNPDRFPIQFFKVFWETIGPDVMKAMYEFHNNVALCQSLNATFIALVLKKSRAVDMKYFRPISLVVSFFKILSKTLTRRMEVVMGSIISANQNGFVRGHQILDYSLIANECIDVWSKANHLGVVV